LISAEPEDWLDLEMIRKNGRVNNCKTEKKRERKEKRKEKKKERKEKRIE
jgi:hypothetical protein